jgi:spermidine/putrescine transport system permease protein
MNKYKNLFKTFAVSTVWLWLGLFAFIPILLIIITSFFSQDPDTIVKLPVTFGNYIELFNNAYLRILLRSLLLATSCTFICLLIGYPFAFIIAGNDSKYKSLLLLLVIIPFWTNSLIRTYAIMTILKANGLLNSILLYLKIIEHPLQILYSQTAILVGCIYDLLPFMILPLYASIEKLNQDYLEAAQDLGANWFTAFSKIIIPLTASGIISGSLLVFLPSMTMFYIPVLLGGAKDLLLGNLIEHQFLMTNNWPLGTAISVIITLLMGIFILIYWKNTKKEQENKENLI